MIPIIIGIGIAAAALLDGCTTDSSPARSDSPPPPSDSPTPPFYLWGHNIAAVANAPQATRTEFSQAPDASSQLTQILDGRINTPDASATACNKNIVAINDLEHLDTDHLTYPNNFIILSDDRFYSSSDTLTYFDGDPLTNNSYVPRQIYERHLAEHLGLQSIQGIDIYCLAKYFQNIGSAQWQLKNFGYKPAPFYNAANHSNDDVLFKVGSSVMHQIREASEAAACGPFANLYTSTEIAHYAAQALLPSLEKVRTIPSDTNITYQILKPIFFGPIFNAEPYGNIDHLLKDGFLSTELAKTVKDLRTRLIPIARRVFPEEANRLLAINNRSHEQVKELDGVRYLLHVTDNVAKLNGDVSFEQESSDALIAQINQALELVPDEWLNSFDE